MSVDPAIHRRLAVTVAAVGIAPVARALGVAREVIPSYLAHRARHGSIVAIEEAVRRDPQALDRIGR